MAGELLERPGRESRRSLQVASPASARRRVRTARSSQPHRSPRRLPPQVEAGIRRARAERRYGPRRVARQQRDWELQRAPTFT